MEDTVLVAPIRRRRHSAEFKAQVIKACQQPGVSIAAIALHYRLNANMLRTWLTAHERAAVSEQSGSSRISPVAKFVPLQLAAPTETCAMQDIVIEVRRGAATITVRWPSAAAAECAVWLQRWLR